MSLVAGQIIQNRYRIDTLLGQGGMGAVYKALDQRLNVVVAVKELAFQPGLDPHILLQKRQQFQQEATVLARLSHPNMVRVTDFFEAPDGAYLVMDFVEGENLFDRVQRLGALPQDQVLVWADHLLDALDYCHRQGILHRDIKPQNVIIRPDGRAILVDFGLVKIVDPRNPVTATIVRGMGTPEYTPPEQYNFAGSGHTDARSDIYALGTTLYHLLTGQAPPPATLRMARPDALAAPRQLTHTLSLHIDSAILRAIALQQQARFQSAAEMRQALAQRHMSPPPLAPGVPQAGRRMPVWAWVLIAVVLLFGAGFMINRGISGSQTRATETALARRATSTPGKPDMSGGGTATATATLRLTSTPASSNHSPSKTPTATATPIPPTPTIVSPTSTSRPPTKTPRLPTSTPIPPTSTAQPPTSTPAPPTSTPFTCSIAVHERFAGIWNAAKSRLGCPTNGGQSEYGAAQKMQYGYMLWRQDTDRIYAMVSDGAAATFEDTFVESDPSSGGYTPPAGYQEPIRGFGKVWRNDLGGPNANIGWAKEHEYVAPNFFVQDFERGFIFWEDRAGNRIFLYNAKWEQW